MAAESNMGFPQKNKTPPTFPFQSGAPATPMEMIPAANYYGIHSHSNTSSTPAGGLPGNTNMVHNNTSNPAIVQATNTPAPLAFHSLPALNYGNAFLAEWSVEEQYNLEQGIQKYANEPSITKYVKIAAVLHEKTVRDVALRCRWTMRKRRKLGEYNAGKNVEDKNDKLAGSSSNSKINIPSISPLNMVEHSFIMHHMDQDVRIPYEVSGYGTAKNLLEQNVHVFEQIAANFSMYKLLDNIDLFCRTRYNITAILNDMKNMPGIMSQMPPLPVCINEDLAASILPYATQTMMFGSPPGIHVKQEPKC